MNMRYAKEEEIDDIKEIWNYCFNDEESFVNYYFVFIVIIVIHYA